MVTTIAFVKKTATELKKASVKLFQGEITVNKKECWLVGIILLLTGIAVGLINAPLTHGVNISLFSHNGCDNGNNSPVSTDVDKLCKPALKKEKNKSRHGGKEYDNQ